MCPWSRWDPPEGPLGRWTTWVLRDGSHLSPLSPLSFVGSPPFSQQLWFPCLTTAPDSVPYGADVLDKLFKMLTISLEFKIPTLNIAQLTRKWHGGTLRLRQ